MAHTDICKTEMCREIDRRKKEAGGIKPAIRLVSKEYEIPACTLSRWYWPEGNIKYNGIKNDSGDFLQKLTQEPQSFDTCAVSDLQALISSGKKFGTILAVPHSGGDRRAGEYPSGNG